MKRIGIGLLIILALTACASKTEDDIQSKIYARYTNLKSYKAEAEVTVKSNLTTKTYNITQYYKHPNKYRADSDGGLKYIFADGDMKILSPVGTDAALITQYIPNDKNYIFVPDFFETYYKSNEAAVQTVKDLSGAQVIMETVVGGGNMYRTNQKIWIDAKTLLPSKLETYDANNQAVLTVDFKEFKLDAKVDDDTFR